MIIAVFMESPTDEHIETQGIQVGRHKVRRLMQDLSLVVRYPKRFKVTTDSHHSESVSPNTLIGNLVLANLIRYGQQTSPMWTLQGWLYVAVVIDLFRGTGRLGNG